MAADPTVDMMLDAINAADPDEQDALALELGERLGKDLTGIIFDYTRNRFLPVARAFAAHYPDEAPGVVRTYFKALHRRIDAAEKALADDFTPPEPTGG